MHCCLRYSYSFIKPHLLHYTSVFIFKVLTSSVLSNYVSDYKYITDEIQLVLLIFTVNKHKARLYSSRKRKKTYLMYTNKYNNLVLILIRN